MRGPEQDFARRPLGSRHVVHELRPRRPKKLHGLRRDVAVEQLLDFQYPEALDFQPDRHESRPALDVEHRLESHLPGDWVGDVELEGCGLDFGAPENPFANRDLRGILGHAKLRLERQAPPIVFHHAVEVAIHHARQTRSVAGLHPGWIPRRFLCARAQGQEANQQDRRQSS